MQLDRVRNAEPRGGVPRPDLAEFGSESLAIGVRDGRRMDLGRIRARAQERRTLRRAQPLVGVADVPVGTDGVDVEVDETGGMGAVDEHRNATGPAPADDVGDREHEGRRRSDVVDDDETGAVVERPPEGIGDFGRVAERHRHRHLDDLRAASLGNEAKGVADRAVHVVGGNDPVPRREAERAKHRVHPARRVLEEDGALGSGPDEPGKRGSRLPDEARQLVHEEPGGLRLHAKAPLVLAIEELARRRAVRPVVEEHHVLFEREEVPERASVLRHAAPPPVRAVDSGPLRSERPRHGRRRPAATGLPMDICNGTVTRCASIGGGAGLLYKYTEQPGEE